jgi:hypothetical protein
MATTSQPTAAVRRKKGEFNTPSKSHFLKNENGGSDV